MKKVVILIISAILFTCNNVYAKDTVKSINKYNNESLEYIIKSYNEENKQDGIVSAGTYLKDTITINDKEYEDIQVMLVKYTKEGKLLWNYDYGKTTKDKLFYLTYTYNAENKIDGYLLLVNTTFDIEENQEEKPAFVKVDLKGKQIEEKESNFAINTTISKVITSYDNENNNDGYIIVGNKTIDNKEIGFIAKYDRDLNEIWQKDYREDNSNIKDIILLKANNIPKEYITIISTLAGHKLIKYDLEGNEQELIKEDFEEKDSPRLLGLGDSYILYGYTHEVKLENNKSVGYYITKYNNQNEEEWETIGSTPTNDEAILEIYPAMEHEELKEYVIMATNDTDSSVEITKIDLDGIIKNKIKKINNDYYDITSFLYDDATIYFIGQINCPEDETCDYDTNSLLLISDEDKVIEVKEGDNQTILIIGGLLILIAIILYMLRRHKRLKNS